ncbi:hypothetical protein [Peribacillus alkalitolerans]|uniref:hypothetical protein n=1 Tax=Peribacillus alkalitolerans TaxID=1550385 RepID=UPI0013D1F2C8|nr:hypothetical protein [Peribacillus alkalitolerans]
MSNKEQINRLKELVNGLANYEFETEEILDRCTDIKEITKNVWDQSFSEIISSLTGLSNNKDDYYFKGDYQLYWLDCLGFPNELLKLKDKNGKIIDRIAYHYGSLPSDFNMNHSFDDSFIEKISLEENNVTNLIIDIKLDSQEYSFARVNFKNVKLLLLDRENDDDFNKTVKRNEMIDYQSLIGVEIICASEIPAIDYFLMGYDLEKEDELKQCRVFNFSVYYRNDNRQRYGNLYVFSRSWEIDKGNSLDLK